jgi:hypothetical protein
MARVEKEALNRVNAAASLGLSYRQDPETLRRWMLAESLWCRMRFSVRAESRIHWRCRTTAERHSWGKDRPMDVN